jgi:hypothetical protein
MAGNHSRAVYNVNLGMKHGKSAEWGKKCWAKHGKNHQQMGSNEDLT